MLPPAGRGTTAFDDSAAHADASRASTASPPNRSPSDLTLSAPAELDGRWTVKELRERYRAAFAQVARGQLEVAQLKLQLAAAPAVGPEPSNPSLSSQPTAAKHNPLEDTFYPPSPSDLADFAKSCTVRVDHPELLDSTPGEVGEAADAMNATPDEVRAMNEVMRGLHTSFRDRLRMLYTEATGHPADSDLSPRAMLGELQDKRPPQNAGLFTDIAKERAGEKPAPTDLSDASAYERAERMYLALGDEFQERVGRTVGPERASALRAASGGWKWSRSQFAGCAR